jgi:hypothetical protein
MEACKMSSSYSILRLLKYLVVMVLVLSATAGTVRAAAGEPGYIMIDGQREFVLGWYKLGATTNPPFYQFSLEVLDEGPVHGFDFAMHYQSWPPHGNGIHKWVEEAGARGMGAMLDMRPLSPNFPTLTSMVNSGSTVPLKDLPGLFGYYLEDEPDGRGLDVGDLVDDYNELKAADPNHLIYTSYYLDFAANAAAGYFDATDVAIDELYPFDSGNPLATWADVAGNVAVAAAEGIGYIAGPWAADVPGLPPYTPEEFKFMVFSAIADGAGGVMPFLFEGWHPDEPGSPYNPNFRKDNIYPTTDIVAQIAEELAKGFTGGLSATSATFEANGGRYVLGGDSERAALVAVNHGPALASVTFTVSGLSAEIAEVTVLGENRTITLTGPSSNQVVDSFDALNGVHVYSFRTPCHVLIDDGQGIPSDFNHDCHVNLLDFSSLAEKWYFCNDPNDPDYPCPNL